jgi:phosphatidylinositol dimannoside acyltransferase
VTTVRGDETWKETAAFWSYRGLERLAPVLPEPIGRRVFAAAGRLAYRRLGQVRTTVAANQARALGLDGTDERVSRSTREAFELYARYWYDTFRIRTMTRAMIRARTDVIGLHHIDAALAKGKGCLTVLPHMGNWDVAGRFLALNGYRIAAVAETLRPARLSELFLRHRRELGMQIVALADTRQVAGQLKRLLAENWIVALVADRDLTGHGIEVKMFGATRRLPSGPARLSLATGAPLLVCPAYTTPAGWRIQASAPLEIARGGNTRADVRELSQRMAAAFERAIAARPSDWHLFQPGWSATPADTTGP